MLGMSGGTDARTMGQSWRLREILTGPYTMQALAQRDCGAPTDSSNDGGHGTSGLCRSLNKFPRTTGATAQKLQVRDLQGMSHHSASCLSVHF